MSINKRYRLTPDEAEILFRYRGLKAASEEAGVDVESVKHGWLKTKQASGRGELNKLNNPELAEKRKFYEKAEKWILRNSKTYVDPENFYNAFVKKFGKDNHLVQAIEGKLTTITNPKLKNLRSISLVPVPFNGS